MNITLQYLTYTHQTHCNMRTMWAWSRRPEHIKFEDDAVATILKLATQSGVTKYTSRVPLVEAADQRIKIA